MEVVALVGALQVGGGESADAAPQGVGCCDEFLSEAQLGRIQHVRVDR